MLFAPSKMSYSVGAAGMFSHTAFVSFRRFAGLNDIMDILYSLFYKPRDIRGGLLLLLLLGNFHLGQSRFNQVGGEGFARFGEGGSA